MIKGVNKKIIEIRNTDSIYFEKAVLYVRPEMSDVPEKHLVNEADNYLNMITETKTQNNDISKVNRFFVCMAVLTAIGAAIILGFSLL